MDAGSPPGGAPDGDRGDSPPRAAGSNERPAATCTWAHLF